MKVISWNVNSLRMRRERVIGLIERHQPDLLCLQETKLPDDEYPHAEFERLGYSSAAFGQRGGYNGVALLSRTPLGQIVRGFDANPAADQARVISARMGDVQVVNAYVVNGQSLDSDKYQLKLDWLSAFGRWIRRSFSAELPLLLLGDFNIAPDDRDVHDPSIWQGKVLTSPAERRWLSQLLQWGLADLLRSKHNEPGIFSWWDYRHGAFQRNLGLRIDLLLGSRPLLERCLSVEIDREERKAKTGPGKPSDHAPVIATFAST